MPRHLTDLIPDYKGASNPEITGLTADSRMVKPGYLFAALPGAKANGNAFIQDAVRNGAAAVLMQGDMALDVPVLNYKNPRLAWSAAASRFYDRQPRTVVAVTGTNGKTSTAHFTQQLWAAIGYPSASLGTLGIHGASIERSGSLTTPDTVALHRDLAELADLGIDHLAMEASSHGLDQYRLHGVAIRAAGFTNLTHEHLDYHQTMDDYRAAKLRLFSEILPEDGTAVINADSPDHVAVRAACGRRTVIDYGFAAKALRVDFITATVGGQTFAFSIQGKPFKVQLPLIGDFMAMNALCALGLAMAECMDDTAKVSAFVEAMASLQPAPGRLQLVPGHPDSAIYVDYAHKPDALETVLRTLRGHTAGRLIVIFGCGGDRDRAKRPMMGRIATDCADLTIVTDDNPRSEDAATIRREILQGAGPGALEIGDRREAIHRGIAMLRKGDVLVIAGKGHEQGQIVGNKTHPFDDVHEAMQAIAGMHP